MWCALQWIWLKGQIFINSFSSAIISFKMLHKFLGHKSFLGKWKLCALTHVSSPVCVIQLIDLDRSLWNAPTISLNIFEMHRQYLDMSGFPSDERVFHACPSTPPVIASQPNRSWFFLRKKSKTCQETSLYASHRFDQQFSQQCWVLWAAGRLTPPFQLNALLSIVDFDPLDQSFTMSRLDKMAKWQNGKMAAAQLALGHSVLMLTSCWYPSQV